MEDVQLGLWKIFTFGMGAKLPQWSTSYDPRGRVGETGECTVTTLQVEASVAGRKRAGAAEHELRIDLTEGPTTLRALIESIVRAEVDAFHRRAADERLVRVLTERELQDGLVAGAVRSGGRDVADEVDADDAVHTALLAHQDGLFQAIVDEAPIDDLDGDVLLRDGTKVTFLRLVALAGG